MKKNTLPGRDGAEGGIGKCVLRRANHLNMTILSPLAYSFHTSHLHHGSPALVMNEWIRGRYLISKQRFIAHSGRRDLWLNWEDDLPMSVITQGFKFGKQRLLWLSGGTDGELASMGVLWQCWGWLCVCKVMRMNELWVCGRRERGTDEEGEARQRSCVFSSYPSPRETPRENLPPVPKPFSFLFSEGLVISWESVFCFVGFFLGGGRVIL